MDRPFFFVTIFFLASRLTCTGQSVSQSVSEEIQGNMIDGKLGPGRIVSWVR